MVDAFDTGMILNNLRTAQAEMENLLVVTPRPAGLEEALVTIREAISGAELHETAENVLAAREKVRNAIETFSVRDSGNRVLVNNALGYLDLP